MLGKPSRASPMANEYGIPSYFRAGGRGQALITADELSSGRFDRIMQQQAIAAPHHVQAMRYQAASLVLAWINLPILLGASKPKQDFGDGSIAFAS